MGRAWEYEKRRRVAARRLRCSPWLDRLRRSAVQAQALKCSPGGARDGVCADGQSDRELARDGEGG
jgi:hypothetical protein